MPISGQTGSGQSLSAADLYINSKAAFGYNYIDGDLDVTHDHDDQGEHGPTLPALPPPTVTWNRAAPM